MFKNEINPYSVTDKVVFRNVDKTLSLTVRADAGRLVAGLKKANAAIAELNEESSECQQWNAAREFATVVFGEEQAQKLIDFYDEPLTVISVCGMYFQKRLAKKITKAQKTK